MILGDDFLHLEGYDVKLNEHITFRMANGKDKDIEGNIVPDGYNVFVKIGDCNVREEEGKRFFDTENAPAIPVLYVDCWYGMGEFKHRKAEKGIEIDGQFVYEYEQAPMYFAYNGLVYVGSVKNLLNYE
jgi:hypothetical protein